jgi:glutathione peroxidase
MFFGKKKQTMESGTKPAKSSIYNISITDSDGKAVQLSQYKGPKILIVNVASDCGWTPQYEDLQLLHEKYGNKLAVLGFPCNDFGGQEPGSEKEIKFFCTENYSVTFPLFSKVSIVGSPIHPLYKWLSDENQNGWNNKLPEWNFWKYLIDEEGNLINYYSQHVNPFDEEIIGRL